MRIFNWIILLGLLVLSNQLTAQESSAPEWLVQLYGENTVASMDQSKIDYYLLVDDQSVVLEDVSPKNIESLPDALLVVAKVEGAPQLSLELLESEDFHFELYQFEQDLKEHTYYRIGNSGKMLTIRSVEFTLRQLENQ